MSAEIATPRWLALVVGLLLPLYLWAGLGNRDVWAPDEPRFALVAREMQMRGNHALPTVNGEPYAHKPPLLFWLINAASELTGRDASDGLTARLPSALAGVGTLVATGLMGNRLFGRPVGMLAPLVLATTHMFCWEAHAAQMDALLTFWIAVATLFLVLYREDPRARHAHGFMLACGLATLTKGPVGFLIPWAVAALWRPGKGAGGLFRPMYLLSFALPVLVWLGAAAAYGGQEYFEALLGKHVMKRYFDSWHHIKPFWFFLWDTPLNLVPWTFLLPAMAVFAHGAWRCPHRARGVRFAAAWVLFMLAFFSFPKGKRGLYMLPAFPPLALLAAATLDAAAREAGRVRTLARHGLALVPVLFVVLLKVISGDLAERLGMVVNPLAVQIALAAGLFAMALAVWRWTVPHLARATVVTTAVVFLAIYSSFLGQLNPGKSPRAFCQQALSLRRAGEPLAFYGVFLEGYALFTGEKLLVGEQVPEFAPHLDRHATVLAFMQKERLRELVGAPALDTLVLVEKRLGDKNMVIARVSRRSPRAAAE